MDSEFAMMSQPESFQGHCRYGWIVAALCAIAALSVFSPTASANAIAVDVSAPSTRQAIVEINRFGRTLYIGQAKVPSSDGGDVRHVTIGRVGDLVGNPVTVVRKAELGRSSAIGAGMADARSLNLSFPTANARLTSAFGLRSDPFDGVMRGHSGIDLAAELGAPVLASGSGLVSTAGWQGGYGLLVSLDHGGGVQTRYGHLSQIAVREGEQVKKGDLVGYVGSTGRSTGPHLHYEVRENGLAIDPLRVTGR